MFVDDIKTKRVLRWFLQANSARVALIVKGRDSADLLDYIIRRFMVRQKSNESKRIALALHWKKTIAEVMKQAKEQDNANMIEFAQKAMIIKEDVQMSVLRHYLRKCAARRRISFFQWRRMFPPKNDPHYNAKSLEATYQGAVVGFRREINLRTMPTPRTRECHTFTNYEE